MAYETVKVSDFYKRVFIDRDSCFDVRIGQAAV